MYVITSNLGEKTVRTFGDVLVLMNTRRVDPSSPREIFTSVTRDGKALAIKQASFDTWSVYQEGTGQEVLENMVNEVVAHYVRPGDEIRQPYQMLSQEWDAVHAVGCAYSCFTDAQQSGPFSYPQEHLFRPTLDGLRDYLFQSKVGYGYNGPTYDGSQQNSRHDVHVGYALLLGKPVPDAVIAEYMVPDKLPKYDMQWFKTLLEVPVLRGAISANKFQSLFSVLRWSKIALTQENAAYFIELMLGLPDSQSGTTDVDNFLFDCGVLKPKELPPPTPVDLGEPFSPLAEKLRDAAVKFVFAASKKRSDKDLAEGNLSKREHAFQIAQAAAQQFDFRFSNCVAKAVEAKDVRFLLNQLDTADDWNVPVKRVLRDELGLKIIGIKASERSKAIFDFCGYDAPARAEYEQRAKDREDAARLARDLEQFGKQAASHTYTVSEAEFPTAVNCKLDGKQYVDALIEKGFNVLTEGKWKGRKCHFLKHAQSSVSYMISASAGEVGYAKALFGLNMLQPVAA